MDYTDSEQEELVSASLYFLRALGNVYGSGSAMETWERLADAIDPDLKGAVFAAMLSGTCGGYITIRDVSKTPNPVAVVKAIRTWDKDAPGLKEAKDKWDGLRNLGRPIKINVAERNANDARRAFMDLGCIVV